ncbi:PDDEXK nuclease domain-containing protein [Draconibacterium sp.]|jgi:predicted nuclease of restriction endonuclease-like (RecB) superfamily
MKQKNQPIMKNFNKLISTIEQVHSQLQASAANAVNQSLTIRNWIIGYYIVEFEQNGEDRAVYGDKLIDRLAEKLKHIKGIEQRSLRRFRQFYMVYPHLETAIRGSLTPVLGADEIRGSLTPILQNAPIVGSATPQLEKSLVVSGQKLLSKLSYTHIEQLLNIDNQLKRTFYELECIKGTWSVRELKRQINSLYFERSGLSANPEKLSALVTQNSIPQKPTDIIKNIYSFEFLDFNIKPIVEESDLETALLTHLQEFILEMGFGFCFEARQKRILIGNEYYFIDLVFYHRILKCHILIDLKLGKFEHGDIGQLNTYLNYFKAEIGENSDNPPVGILLVAEKENALVKYATAGMDQNLFIQQYLIQLPSTDQLKNYIEKELKKADI